MPGKKIILTRSLIKLQINLFSVNKPTKQNAIQDRNSKVSLDLCDLVV